MIGCLLIRNVGVLVMLIVCFLLKFCCIVAVVFFDVMLVWNCVMFSLIE